MRKLLIIILGAFMLSGLLASPPPMDWEMAIPNNIQFTEEQIDLALDYYRGEYEDWVQDGTGGEPGDFSKGQTGLLILDLFALSDTLKNAAGYQQMIIADQLFEMFEFMWYLEESFFSIIDSVEDQYDLIDNLYDFMVEGRPEQIMMLKDSLVEHFYDRLDMTYDNLENTLWNLEMFGDSLGTRFDTVLWMDEDFEFNIGEVSIIDTITIPLVGDVPVLDTSEVATIYDETYESIWAGVNYFEQGIEYLGVGIENILDGDSTMQVGLDTLALSMKHFQLVLDTLNNFHMWSVLNLANIDSTDLNNVKEGFKEVEDIIEGKSYSLMRYTWESGNPEPVDSFEVLIRPIGIVENIHHGLYRTYIDMYWQTDPYSYTFRNIIPSGLPFDIMDQLQPDMIINPMDSLEVIQAYFDRMEGVYREGLFLDSTNIDAHVGLGYIMTFNMLRDAGMQAKTIAALVDGGRIDSLFQNYDWSNLDYTDEIDEIRYHLFKQVDAYWFEDTTVIYTILVKDPYMSSAGEAIVEGDLVYPIYIIPEATDAVLMTTFIIENAINAAANAIEYVYTEIDSIIDITLNPNTLNLSNIEEPLDLIYALETSNPNFGAFTPMGKMKFAAFGDSLAVGMQGLADFADTVVATMDYAELLMYEFGMDSSDYEYMMMDLYMGSMVLDWVAADLATPEVYTIIDDDTLNLSAWFDNVPDNMLTVWKDYFEGRDSSLAGFFPMRMVTPGIDPNYVPAEFALNGNYPNPFNPLTTISFDLPNDGIVKMDVFNIMGRKVATLIDQDMNAGSYEMTWNAANHSSGVYIVRVQHGTDIAYQKMTLLK